MKNFYKTSSALFVALLGLTFVSCSDDKDEPIDYKQLPTAAQTFINTYFGDTSVVKITSDKDKNKQEYEVDFANGFEVTFNKDGEWIDVDAPTGMTIPDGIAPEPIANYVSTYYPDLGINEIEKVTTGYKVDLINELELEFDAQGQIIGNEAVNPPAPTVQLPENAQKFLNTYFKDVEIETVKYDADKENQEYDVILYNGFEITFDKTGEWTDVDAPTDQVIPDGIAPESIASYVSNNYPGLLGIKEISKDKNGYDVELSDGTTLLFNLAGEFQKVDY